MFYTLQLLDNAGVGRYFLVKLSAFSCIAHFPKEDLHDLQRKIYRSNRHLLGLIAYKITLSIPKSKQLKPIV